MQLWICEKPDQGRHVAERLGIVKKENGYFQCQGDRVLTWCVGHLLELLEPVEYDERLGSPWRLDVLPFRPEGPFKKKLIKRTMGQAKVVIELIRKADSIVHCGDPDGQGQLLVQEIIEHAASGFKGPVRRCLVNDLTPSAIDRSIANLRDNQEFQGMYQGELAWQYADWAYGLNLSRLVTLLAKAEGFKLPGKEPVIKIGRVKSAIATMVINRYDAHHHHQKQVFYNVIGQFSVSGMNFPAKYAPAPGDLVDAENRLTDQGGADAIAKRCSGQAAVVASCETDAQKEQPPLPFNLIKLQAAAAKLYKMRPKHVLDMVQSLYEHKLLTYPRSDCQYLTDDQHALVPAVIAAVAATCPGLAQPCKMVDPAIKGRAFNSGKVSAHHAIVPTATSGQWDGLSVDEQKVYHLAARAYLAQFMPAAEYERTQVVMRVGEDQFACHAKILKDPGWKALYAPADFARPGEDDAQGVADDEVEISLNALRQGDAGQCASAAVAEGATKPLPLYTMASLLLDLTQMSKYLPEESKKLLLERDADKEGESGGIGTPATRSDMIAELFENAQIKEEKKGKTAFIVPTPEGITLFSAVPEVVRSLANTANWYEMQKDVVAGKIGVYDFFDQVWAKVVEAVENAKREGLGFVPDAPKCPKCSRPLRLVELKGDKPCSFFGCSGYPDCPYAAANDGGKPGKELEPRKQAEDTGFFCPKCGKPLRLRHGSRGDFFGCSGIDCKVTMDVGEDGKPVERKPGGEPTGFTCPKCGKPMVMRSRKDGSGQFFSCSGFPDCKAAMDVGEDGKPVERKPGGEPTGFNCPKCGKPLVKRSRKDGSGQFFSCSGFPDCKTAMDIGDDGRPVERKKNEAAEEKPGEGGAGAAVAAVACPECGAPLVRRPAKSGNGHWWGCSAWKEKGCQARFGDKDGAPDLNKRF